MFNLKVWNFVCLFPCTNRAVFFLSEKKTMQWGWVAVREGFMFKLLTKDSEMTNALGIPNT